MNSEVSPATINKLGNDVLEIRLRALKAVELQFKVYDHLNFNGPFLMKALIKWFDFDQVCEETRVLHLIYDILKGDQRDDTICTLGLTKLKEKFQIIEQRLQHDSHKDVLKKIQIYLSNYGQQSETDMLDDTTLDVMSNISVPCERGDDLALDTGSAFDCLDYIVPWEIPGPADLNSLNLLKSSLRLDADTKDILHAITFLKTAIVDFPAEYFLQPPYIFQCLKSLLTEKSNGLCTELLVIFGDMTKALQKRVKIRQLSRTFCLEEERHPQNLKKTQISVARYFSEVFQITLNYFKDIIHTNTNSSTLQQEFHCCFTVMLELIDLVRLTSGKYLLNDILKDLGYLTKYFRKTCDKSQMDQSNRNLYINTLYLMSKIVILKHELDMNSTSDTHQDKYSSHHSLDSKFSSQSQVNIWRQELETALFDFLLKQSYSEVYDTVTKAVQTYNDIDAMVQHLLNCDLILKPAVELLQEPFIQNNEEFITSSLMVIQTLSLHRSNDLVQRIFAVVQESVSFFDGNTNLKDKCETILLKLIAHEDVHMKRTIYRLCCKNVKSYFSNLMEGSAILSKTYSSNPTNVRFLGIPLTSEIITEFISFGLDHIDEQIRNNAETILSLVLKSKSMMSTHWTNIFEILAPAIPLLLCHASKKTTLGHAILSMLTPDSDLPTQYLIQGNVILLFSPDYQIRQDALAALMYLLLDQNDAELYLPNIQNITDVIPSNICILDSLINPKQKCISGIHERQSMDSLIELLQTSSMDPGERKTSFLQLNILTQDPELTEIFHNASGLYLCLDALQNALKENQSSDYHDSVIPVIGILTKMFLQIPEYRREFVHDTNTYYMLLRALLIFHQHSVLKADCSIILFILAFGEHSLGSYNVSVPNVCSKLKVPFICEYHGKESQFNQKSHIECLLLNSETGQSSDRHSNNDPDTDRSHMSAKLKTMWQYVRLQFANLWFGGIDHISIDFTCSADKDLSVVYSSADNYPDAMAFDKRLSLTKADLKLIQATNISYVFKYWLNTISNATRHSDVTKALSAISNNLFSPGICKDELNVGTISTTLMRFYASTPNTEMDELIFVELLAFFENLIRNDYDEFLHWLLQEFRKTNCIFINLLQSSSCSSRCYTLNCRFIGVAFEYAIYSDSENIRMSLMADLPKIRNETERTNILNKMFSLVMPLLDSTFEKGDLDKFRSLLSLLQIVTSSLVITIDEEFIGHIANKLLHFISSIKSLAQTGSNLNKNCLLVVSNLMHTSEHDIHIESKYIKFLSGLCGHKDVEIRTFSWMILTLLSKKLRGAETLIECLSYLPGGFHACCLSTLLDNNESSTVRELAGTLFANLIQFVDANRNLLESVVPRCGNRPITQEDNSFDLIVDIIKYQRFFERVAESLKHFFVYELIDDSVIATPITTCDIVRVYCGILTSLININEGLVELFYDCGLLFDIIRLIPYVKSSTNESALLMLNAICTFMSHCFVKDVEILNKFGLQEHAVFLTLVHCLQSKIYDDFDDDLKMTTFNCIIPIVTFVANSGIGYNLIWNLFTRNEMQPLFEAMVFGLQTKDNLTVSVLKLLSSLLTSSGKSETDHFANLFDEMEARSNQPKHAIVNGDDVIGYQKLVGKRKTEIEHASELIFSFLVDLFHGSKNGTKIRSNLCKTIALLLFGSVEVRKMALDIDFVTVVLDEIESILSKIGVYGDFVRKYGEQKKEPIISQLKWLYNILMHWFSKDCLKDETVIVRLCQILIQTWPWTGANSSFQLLVNKTLAFLSEDSVPVCKAMATSNVRNSQTVLQIVTDHAVSETAKPKQPNSNLESLELTLRTISNCCSCVEGRIQLTKLNALDTLNRLHPTVTKQYKPWNTVLLLWLELYEIYTRYPDISTTKHLQLLCYLAMKATLKLKMVSLTIIRNMAFGSNRPALLASDVLLQTLSHQLESGTEDVRVLVGTCIWKLIANNYRGKHTVRSTSIPAKVISIRNSCVSTDQSSELFYILDTLHNILSN
ncbi:uncharacterized protein LOC119071380 isoform X2 [Bradysia coprophila]|uniref:uncharacterized protein LOC119071380 isoform X2 n=1 Tax=Bradysia coprophila TaxID=38358 RepID=UPI00187DC404|nr:uncharacterized protein LOC119071380 isoform X2 [Bradysia coprophila]